uniref:Uncharacterized protein n=1 Tax=Arundo donax TaxID=35708 RepID=A0A0A9BBS3_ARUDO
MPIHWSNNTTCRTENGAHQNSCFQIQ